MLDVIPVDYVINAMLAAMFATASRQPPLTVYHAATSTANPLYHTTLAQAVFRHFRAQPFADKKVRCSFVFLV